MVTVIAGTKKREEQVAGIKPRDTVIIWYHQDDQSLLETLNPHLQVLMLRLDNRFQLHYFRSPRVIPQVPKEQDTPFIRENKEADLKEYQHAYTGLLLNFSRAAVFLPCVSPTFMIRFWQDHKRDERLQSLLTQPNFPVFPILTHPMAGVTTYLKKSLGAYEGNEREEACATIAAGVEALLQKHYPLSETKQPAPFLMLEASREAPHPEKRSFFSSWFKDKNL